MKNRLGNIFLIQEKMETTRSRRKDLPWDFLKAAVAESNFHLPDRFSFLVIFYNKNFTLNNSALHRRSSLIISFKSIKDYN